MTSRNKITIELRRGTHRYFRNALFAAMATVCCVFVLALLVAPALPGVSAQNASVLDVVADDSGPSDEATSDDDGADASESDGAEAEPEQAEERWEEGVVLVRLDEDASAAEVSEALSGMRCLASTSVTDDDIDLGFAKLPLAQGFDVEGALAELEAVPAIKGAQPNFIYHLADDATPSLLEQQSAIIAGSMKGQSVPNDPSLSSQWALESIHAFEAWDIVKAGDAGDDRVTVAVVDNGCLVDHEDLAANIVDPYNAVDGGTDVTPIYGNHGTHVAGIISATANNGKGIAGVSYNARLLPIQAFVDSKNATTQTIVAAFKYIVKNAERLNIKVANMSIGGSVPNVTSRDDVTLDNGDIALIESVSNAYNAGILTVCSSGNDAASKFGGKAYFNYPSDWLDCAISVIALKNGTPPTRAGYSNYNMPGQTTKDISAPGGVQSTSENPDESIYSTYADEAEPYGYLHGTSMASPCVAGVAALVYSLNPSFTPAEVTDILCSTTTPLGTDEPGGWTEEYGHGEVNAYAAVQEVAKNWYITGKAEMLVGGQVQLATTKEGVFAWSSSDVDVATVDEGGLVTGVGGGTATITASQGSLTISREVTVYDISFSGPASVSFGQSVTLDFNENPNTGLWYIDSENTGEAPGTSAASGAFSAGSLRATTKVGSDGTITVYGNRAGSARVSATLATSIDLVVLHEIEVVPRSIEDAAFSWAEGGVTYNGEAQELRPDSVTLACAYGDRTQTYALEEGIDYTLSYANNTAAGTATVTVTGIGNFTGSFAHDFQIARRNVSLSSSSSSKAYDGKALVASKVAVDGDGFVEGEVSNVRATGSITSAGTVANGIAYDANSSFDSANYIITKKEGTLSVTRASLAKVSVSGLSAKAYSGAVYKPAPVVKLGAVTLVASRDYTVSYSSANPKKVGAYTVTISGKGNYTGTLSKTYKITRAAQSLKLTTAKKALKAKALAKKAKKVKGAIRAKGAKTAVSYKITSVSKKKYAKKFSISKKGVITVKKGTPRGTYKLKVRVRAKATANYKQATKSKTVTIRVE